MVGMEEKQHSEGAFLPPSQGGKLDPKGTAAGKKLILQFLHVDFCVCLCSLPDTVSHLALNRAAWVPSS